MKEKGCFLDVIYYYENNGSVIECQIPYIGQLKKFLTKENLKSIANAYICGEMKKREKAKENHDKFLQELSRISQKYDIYIGGCGCCGSPYLESKNYEIEEFGSNRLEYNFDKQMYEVE